MEENNNIDELDVKFEKKPFFKDKKFWLGIACTLVPFVLLTAIPIIDGYYLLWIIPLIAIIPYGILGIILWATIRRKKRNLALGLMIGCLIPITVTFIVTGGCGLMNF